MAFLGMLGFLWSTGFAAAAENLAEISFRLGKASAVKDVGPVAESLTKRDSILEADVDPLRNCLVVRYHPDKITAKEIQAAVESLGVSAELEPFHIRMTPRQIQSEVGKQTNFELILGVGQGDAYVHPQAPLKVVLSAPSVAIEKKELKRSDAVAYGDPEKAKLLRFTIPVTAEKKGEHTLTADVEFYFCTPKLCILKTGKATAQIKS